MGETINLKVDARGRITIGSLFKGYNVSSFKAYFNKDNKTITLEPLVEIPLSDAWVFEDKDKLKTITKSLQEAKDGKLEYIEDFTKYVK